MLEQFPPATHNISSGFNEHGPFGTDSSDLFSIDIAIVKPNKMDNSNSHGAKNGIDEAESDSKIGKNDDGILLEPITRAASQSGPRRTSVFPREK